MKELHLKFQSDTGSQRCTELDIEFKEHATDAYLEWLEDLAEKYMKQQKINADANKVMAKMGRIKMCFESLKSNINAIDSNDVEAYEIIQIADDCDDLESEIYD